MIVVEELELLKRKRRGLLSELSCSVWVAACLSVPVLLVLLSVSGSDEGRGGRLTGSNQGDWQSRKVFLITSPFGFVTCWGIARPRAARGREGGKEIERERERECILTMIQSYVLY